MLHNSFETKVFRGTRSSGWLMEKPGALPKLLIRLWDDAGRMQDLSAITTCCWHTGQFYGGANWFYCLKCCHSVLLQRRVILWNVQKAIAIMEIAVLMKLYLHFSRRGLEPFTQNGKQFDEVVVKIVWSGESQKN